MAKTGRPLLEGVVRYTSGRINQTETAKLAQKAAKALAQNDTAPPSPRIANERALFNAKCFKGGGQSQHAGDAIGQLWLVGLLDTKGMDETRLLDAVRRWWRGREAVFAEVGPKTARYERASRSSGKDAKTSKVERDYYHYNGFLMDAAQKDQDALVELMTPDVDGIPRDWVCRIVQTEILRHTIRLEAAVLAGDKDYKLWEAAKRAIVAMAGMEATAKDAA